MTVEAAFKYYATERNAEDTGFEAAEELDDISYDAMAKLEKLNMKYMPDKGHESNQLLRDCYFYTHKAGFYAGFEMALDMFTAAKRQKLEPQTIK